MKTRHTLTIVALVAVGSSLLYLVSTAWHDTPAVASPKTASPDPAVMTARVENTPPVEQNHRTRVEPADPTATVGPTTGTFRLRGRCLDAAAATPLPGCRAQTRRELTAAAALDPWSTDAPTAEDTTGDNGTFDLLVPIDPRHENAALRLSKAGFVPRMTRWKRPAIDSTIDVGDIPMQRAIRVTGKVTHPDGAAAGDVGILFANVALTDKAVAEPARMLRTRTDAGGRFRLAHAAFPGEWYPRVEGSGALIEPQMVVLGAADGPDYSIQLIVEKPDPKFTITGVCVDEAGRPLAQVHVTGTGGGFTGQGWSKSDGRVTIPRAGPVPLRGDVSLWAYDTDGLFEQVLPAAKTKFHWGDRDVRFVLRRLAQQRVHVVNARGVATIDFSLFTFRDHEGRLTRYPRLSLHGHHRDGRLTLSGLRNGGNAVIVAPTTPGLGSTELIRFVADGTGSPGDLRVTVPDLATLEVQVADPFGAAVAGSRVELLQALRSAAPTATTGVVDLDACDRGRGTPAALRLTAATTDAAGRVTLDAPPGAWFLRITGERHMARVQPVQVAATGSSLRATVELGCALAGTVGPRAAVERLRSLSPGGQNPVTIELRRSDDATPSITAVAADGSYRIAGVPPGRYAVALRYWMRTSTVTEGWIKSPITSIELLPSQPYELPIDASQHLPGRVSGSIFVDGAPLADKHCFAKRREPSPQVMLRFATDRDGHFEASIPPGTYSYSITLEAQPGPGWILITPPERWQLAPGGTREQGLAVQLRTVRVQVLGADDAPLANQSVTVSAKDFHRPGELRTDAAGWVTITPAPLDTFHLTAAIHGAKTRLGPIDLPAGETRGDVRVRVEGR